MFDAVYMPASIYILCNVYKDKMFTIESVFYFYAYLVKSFITSSLNAEVDHGVGEGPTHVELQGQVVNPLNILDHVILDGYSLM